MQNAIKKIDELVFNKKYEEAIDGLEYLIGYVEEADGAFEQQLAFLYYYKASLLNLTGKSREALAPIAKACELDSENAKYFSLRSHIYENLGRNDAAMQDQISVLQKMPAIIQGREKEFENAVKYMKEIGKNYENGEFNKEELMDFFMNLAQNNAQAEEAECQEQVEQEGAECLLAEPKNYPSDMVNAICCHAKNVKEINAIWLKLMIMNNEQSYLLIVDCNEDIKNIFDGIGHVGQQYLPDGMYIDMVPYNDPFGQQAATGEPFYRR